jgi:hypothetical protein
MTVTLELEPELERGLKERARACDVTVESFVCGLISREVRVVEARRTLNLPARNLGEMGSLHRRDIYDDVR